MIKLVDQLGLTKRSELQWVRSGGWEDRVIRGSSSRDRQQGDETLEVARKGRRHVA